MARCCCGQFDLDPVYGPEITHDNRTHQILGPDGNFCGPDYMHTIKNLQQRLATVDAENERLKAELKEQEDIVLGNWPITCGEGVKHDKQPNGCLYCTLDRLKADKKQLAEQSNLFRRQRNQLKDECERLHSLLNKFQCAERHEMRAAPPREVDGGKV